MSLISQHINISSSRHKPVERRAVWSLLNTNKQHAPGSPVHGMEKKNEERKDLVALHILSATADTFNYFYLGKRGGENCLEYFEEITDL